MPSGCNPQHLASAALGDYGRRLPNNPPIWERRLPAAARLFDTDHPPEAVKPFVGQANHDLSEKCGIITHCGPHQRRPGCIAEVRRESYTRERFYSPTLHTLTTQTCFYAAWAVGYEALRLSLTSTQRRGRMHSHLKPNGRGRNTLMLINPNYCTTANPVVIFADVATFNLQCSTRASTIVSRIAHSGCCE